MLKRLVRVIAYGLACSPILICVATSALAHGSPFTVRAGSLSNDQAFAMRGTASKPFVFKDARTGQAITCAGMNFAGSGRTGSLDGVAALTVNAADMEFLNCSAPAGMKFRIRGSGTFYINLFDSTSGVTTISLTNLILFLQSNEGPACSFELASTTDAVEPRSDNPAPGYLRGKYTNSGTQLDVAPTGGSADAWNMSGGQGAPYCVSKSIFGASDAFTVATTIIVKATVANNNPISIT